MAKPQIVVLAYMGPEPDKSMLLDLDNAVMGVGGYAVKVHVMDDADIAKAAAKFVCEQTTNDSEENPMEHAIVYIGEKFKYCLMEDKNMAKFAAEIARAATIARIQGGDPKLLKAIEIIYNGGKVSKKLADKYGINRAALVAIRAAAH